MLTGLKPSVSTKWLLTLAGLMWSIVGVILCRISYVWIEMVHWHLGLPLGLIGIVLALIVYRFGFSNIARKNIDRICMSSEKKCIFAFQAWKSYLIIGIMITFGIILRKSSIPKYYLSTVYATIGGALLLSSFQYYARLWRTVMKKKVL